MSQRILFENLSWMDVERYLKRDNRIVVTIGSCEQHAYLSLLTDTLVAREVAREVCTKEGIIMTPPFPYGISTAWTGYPGTISLKPTTFLTVIQEIVEELIRQGFRRILINNGHGGNSGALDWVQDEINNSYPDVRVGTFEWWRHPIVMEVYKEVGLPPGHANWSENFTFTRLGPVPQNAKPLLKEWPRAPTAADYRKALGDGSRGGLYQASDEVIDRFFGAAMKAMSAELSLLS